MATDALRRVIRACAIFVLIAMPTGRPAKSILRGFTPKHSEYQRDLERKFMALPDASLAESEHAILTAEPHIAGSQGDRRTAEYVVQQFRSFGLEAVIEKVQVTLSEPRDVRIELLEPARWSGPSPENVTSDPASSNPGNTVGFNAYSASGDVTATVVYANYGLPDDYEVLREKNISVEGRIVIARYGMCYRGVKARVAEENQAAALIIYSDPNEDGYHAGDTYPDGPWRPSTGVERGSVLYDFIYPGTTPDRANQPHIPVMPLSYSDAAHILSAIRGPSAPKAWQGGLPFTYHLGPGPAKVRMRIQMEEPTKTIWNVVARIPGSTHPDELVIAGNHRDAWTYGGVDPNSGTVAMIEVARSLGVLLRTGWRPQRSIMLCSWDAEEQDELGSTKWSEKHEEELHQSAVAYLNLDAATSGDLFSPSSTPSLKRFMIEVSASVPDPRGGSILAQTKKHFERIANHTQPGVTVGNPSEDAPAFEIPVDSLGGGTDYVAFYNHLGIPSTDFSFNGDYGQYHSIFDNHKWMKEFGDPHFLYHVAAARLYGLEILRLAQADVLPLNYQDYSDAIRSGLTESRTKSQASDLASALDWDKALRAVDEMKKAAEESQLRCVSSLQIQAPSANFHATNRALVEVEQSFLNRDGLPERPWYRHLIFAPGMDNGYSGESLPGIQHSLNRKDIRTLRLQLEAVTSAVARATELLRKVDRQ